MTKKYYRISTDKAICYNLKANVKETHACQQSKYRLERLQCGCKLYIASIIELHFQSCKCAEKVNCPALTEIPSNTPTLKSHGSDKAMCQEIFHILSCFKEITINLYMPELSNTFYPSRVSEMGFNGPKKYTPPINSYL